MPELAHWRGCNKCSALFFNGFPDNKGRCPRDGQGHVADGFIFVLPHTSPGPQPAQPNWRGCNKCGEMFFDGFPDNKGRCPAGGGHVAQSDNYFLPYDVPATRSMQPAWRGCNDCGATFFDGFPDNKGFCPARGAAGHLANSFNFVLPHPIYPFLRVSRQGADVRIVGSWFTPYDRVTVALLTPPAGSSAGPTISTFSVGAQTDRHGDFAATMGLSDDGTTFGVTAVDNATGTEVRAGA